MNEIFKDLFVLELANNHLGKVERGLNIIHKFGTVVRHNNVKAAIKLQIRDVPTFIHKDHLNSDSRYIKKTLSTELRRDDFIAMADSIRRHGCMVMATPFDEKSVDLCVDIGCEAIKVASSDINDWGLLECIAKTRLPVIVSTGGSSLKDTDDIVKFFSKRRIPLALNHCVSLYPTDEDCLELNQIDFLRERYPNNVIGLSTHEHADWEASMHIAYAKGARTFERHVDIDDDGVVVSPYCSTPKQIGTWFKAYQRAKAMCGLPGTEKRVPCRKEVEYLDALVRGCYAARDLAVGHVLQPGDIYLAIPLQKGQLSCRELFQDDVVRIGIDKDKPVMADSLSSYATMSEDLVETIMNRGI